MSEVEFGEEVSNLIQSVRSLSSCGNIWDRKIIVLSAELKYDPLGKVTAENKELMLIFLLQIINLELDSPSTDFGSHSLICYSEPIFLMKDKVSSHTLSLPASWWRQDSSLSLTSISLDEPPCC